MKDEKSFSTTRWLSRDIFLIKLNGCSIAVDLKGENFLKKFFLPFNFWSTVCDGMNDKGGKKNWKLD
jgi:hypothetical protein